MSAYWSIVSRAPGDVPLVLVDGPPYDPFVMVAKQLPSPSWSHDFSGGRGTRGRKPSPGEMENTTWAFGFDGIGADKDEMNSLISDLASAADRCRRYGGRIVFREHGQTYGQELEVLVGSTEMMEWGTTGTEVLNEFRQQITVVCEPGVYWAEMDFSDDFTEDLISTQYEADAGALTNVQAADGLLVSAASPTTENRLIVTGPGHQLGDHEARVYLRPGATITGLKGGVVIKRIDAANYLEVYLDDNGTNSRLRIDKVVAGTPSNLASVNLTARMSVGYGRWTVRGRIEGGVVYAECFLPVNTDSLSLTPDKELDYTLSAVEAELFGPTQTGLAGLVFLPQDSAAALEHFEIAPFTYRDLTRRVIEPCGEIPGDMPAVCDVVVSYSPTIAQHFGMIAWSPKPDPYSYVHNWGFEETNNQWSVAAVSGVTGAATSVTRITTDQRFGRGCGSVVFPANANRGVSYRMDRLFRRGMTYTASLWVKSAADTTNTRLRLGVSGDIASETATALSATWTKRTVTWTPAADTDVAYLAFEITAATATTARIDGALVYQGAEEPVLPAKAFSGHPPWGYIDGVAAYLGGNRVANADADGGFYHQWNASVSSGGATMTENYGISPDILPPDDYAGDEMEVEIWARFLLSEDFDGGVTVTVALSDWGYTHDWGAGGTELVMPDETSAFKICRLGTVTMRRVESARAIVNLGLIVVVGAGTNAQPFGLDCLWLVNPNACAWTPTAIDPDDAYPTFWGQTPLLRHVYSDLSGADETNTYFNTAPTMGGAPIEIPSGPFELLIVSSNEVPDAPTPTPGETTEAGQFHLRVRPRSQYLRY